MTLASIGAFLLANWKWILIVIVILTILKILGSVLHITWFVLKVLFFPFWLLGKLLKPCFNSIKAARAEKKSAEHKE